MQDLQRIIWLASFPKSGNTWMRYLLAQYFSPKGAAPDINHISQFTTFDSRQDLFNAVTGGSYFGETFDDWVKLRAPLCRHIALLRTGTHFVKTHCQIGRVGDYDIIPPEVTAAAVYMMRNPFDVAPSFARHLGIDVDMAIDKMTDATSTTMTETRIFDTLGRWDAHLHSWLTAPGLPIYAVRYEDLVANPKKTMMGLLDFLRVPVDRPHLRRAIKAASLVEMRKQEKAKGFRERPKHLETFFHGGTSGGWRKTLTPVQIGRIREAFLPAIEKFYPEMLAETSAAAMAE